MKYIDTEKLIAEIKKRQEYLGDHNFHSMADEYDWLLTIVQSLQQEQPEVDLEKEINRLWDSLCDELEGPHNKFDIYARCARHFYELGLNAKK